MIDQTIRDGLRRETPALVGLVVGLIFAGAIGILTYHFGYDAGRSDQIRTTTACLSGEKATWGSDGVLYCARKAP